MSNQHLENQPLDNSNNLLPRQKILEICETALACQSFRFGRQVLLNWLVIFPGDLQAAILLHRTLMDEGKIPQAMSVLNKLRNLDIEDRAVWEAAANSTQLSGEPVPELISGTIYALGGSSPQEGFLPEWSLLLRAARHTLRDGFLDQVSTIITDLIVKYPDNTLVMLTHLQMAALSWPASDYLRLALEYHNRYPDCLQFGLHLAEAQIQNGDQKEGVNLLHHCAANDATGQTARRMWGDDHPYLRLWPDRLEIPFDIPIPADVASAMGWNLLSSGEIGALEYDQPKPAAPTHVRDPQQIQTAGPQAPGVEALVASRVDEVYSTNSVESLTQLQTTPPTQDENIKSVEEAFNHISTRLKQPSASRLDGRFPIYVIFSTEAGLLNQYGEQGAGQIKTEMNNLANTIARKKTWGSLVFLPDSPTRDANPGVNPVDSLDPWKLKLALVDLDQALEKKGSMIGALLIVGGDQVIPFHRLPNPTDDVDHEVLSDNPYMTLDSNYFVPEYPTGRLPGEKGKDPTLLLEQLRRIISSHQNQKNHKGWQGFALPQGWLDWLRQLFHIRSVNPSNSSLGYSAAVWEKSSQNVFRMTGGSSALYICPPDDYSSMQPGKITGSKLGYYNLHGTKDGADWYGQRDSVSLISGNDYPVALKIENLTKNGSSPLAVFSEACYGTNIIEKSIQEALSLKFIEVGTPVMVGSTCIAYGSIEPPLIGADLIASYFWKHYLNGSTAGDALRQAKIDLSVEMDRRQGFLDGEDQKTLISFILLGDPLAVFSSSKGKTPKAIQRLKTHPKVTTVCEHTSTGDTEIQIPAASMHEIKLKLSVYLPGLDTAEMHYSHQKTYCSGKDHHCATSENEIKNRPHRNPGNVVVTLSKQIQSTLHTHYHYARATVDKHGKLIKLVVSR